MKKLTDVLNKLPHVHKFTIPMVADSTNEVWTDINTRLGNGDGWLISGLDFTWENVDPTIPNHALGAGTLEIFTLQIHRNADNEVLLPFNDDDVLLHYNGHASATAFMLDGIFRNRDEAVTTKPRLRVLFRSLTDMAQISAATIRIAGKIYYYPLNGPKNAGFTKHGPIKEL